MTLVGAVVSGALMFPGCHAGDTMAPVPQPDTLVFGRLTAIRAVEGEAGASEVEIKAGLPESLKNALARDKRPVPQIPVDLVVKVAVNADTVCVAGVDAGDLDGFRVGQEVVVIPRPGSCAMVGSRTLLAEADELFLFSVYQRSHLPGSLAGSNGETGDSDDRGRVNSSGLERTPLPVDGGRVVYFAAGLLPPLRSDGQPRGAMREGMTAVDGNLEPWVVLGHRPYRVAWTGDRWEEPHPVILPGLAATSSARITWVNDDETWCLVEAVGEGGARSLLESRRATPEEQWSTLQDVPVPSPGTPGDGQRFGSSLGALVWTVYDGGSSDLWLSLEGSPGQPVDPRINTLGSEWAPRVGPNTSLLFCRGVRQLELADNLVREVRLSGKQRRPLLEAVTVRDGELLFFRLPRYGPGGSDWDLAVAPRIGDGWGEAVRLDEWRPQ